MSDLVTRLRKDAARALLRAPVALYRWRLGFLLGGRFLLVVHTGRRSGLRYRTVVEVVGHDGDRWFVMSGFGRTADWFRNLTAAGSAQVHVGRDVHTVAVRELDVDAAAAVLGSYEDRNRWMAPVVRRVLSRLVGWRYAGGDADRRRLVEQLPILELTAVDPRPAAGR